MIVGIDSIVFDKSEKVEKKTDNCFISNDLKSDFYKNFIPIRIVEKIEKPIYTKYNRKNVVVGENDALFRSFDFR